MERVGGGGGQLLAKCLPISSLALLDGGLILVAEGPSLILYPHQRDHPQPLESGRRGRSKKVEGGPRTFQIFPNQATITGMEFLEDYSTPGEVGVVWANSSLRLISIHPEPGTLGHNLVPHPVHTLDFIPIAARWLDDGRRLALISLQNHLFLYDVDVTEWTTSDPKGGGLREEGIWDSPQGGCETLYCATLAGDSLASLVIFSGTSLQGILVWRVVGTGNGKGHVELTHRLSGGHEGIPFSLHFHPQFNLLLSSSDDRSVIVWTFSKSETPEEGEEEAEWNDKLVARAQQFTGLGMVDDKKETKDPRPWLPPFARVTRKLVGHEARVWKASWVTYQGFLFIVSLGEDSLIRVSSYDETVAKSWKGHDGASIYTSVYDQINDLLFTGAHDGAVYKWAKFYAPNTPVHIPYDKVAPHPWTDHLLTLNQFGRSIANKDYPRNICLWRSDHVLALMDSGRLAVYSYYEQFQRNLWHHPNLKRYGVLAVSKNNLFLAIGGLRGEFWLLSTHFKDGDRMESEYSKSRLTVRPIVERQFPCKIIQIHWMEDDTLILIVTLTTAHFYRFIPIVPAIEKEKKAEEGTLEDLDKVEVRVQICCTFSLSHLSRPGLPSALLTADYGWLLAGDEIGSISLYRIPLTDGSKGEELREPSDDPSLFSITPSSYLRQLHKEGVYTIVEYRDWILCGGRYGGIKKLAILEQELVLLEEYSTPFEWVARMVPILQGRDLLVGGFHKGSFFVWSWEQGRILEEIPNLGNGHRRWDWRVDPGDGDENWSEGKSSLIFLRDREIYFAPVHAHNSLNAVLKPGLHSKTINCGVLLAQSGRSHYFATGSDDTTIRVIEYSTVTHSFRPLHRITSHGSSVRALVSTPLPLLLPSPQPPGHRVLLWSGGGKSELHATIIGLTPEGVGECSAAGRLVLGGLNKKKRGAEENDIRIMALSLLQSAASLTLSFPNDPIWFILGAACSDGLLRLIVHFPGRKRFVILALLEGNGHALLTTGIIHIPQHQGVMGVLGGTSNGDLILWKVKEEDLSQEIGGRWGKPGRIPAYFTSPVRPCAVMSMALRRNGCDHEMVLGGDDCSVSRWRLRLGEGEGPEGVELCWSENQTQRGAVTGVYWGWWKDEGSIFSCSNDQVIARWGVDGGGGCRSWAFAGVRDVQGFIVSGDEDLVTVFGHGITWITKP